MRKSDIPVAFVASRYPALLEIRAFGWGRVMAGAEENVYFLIVQERGNPSQTLYEYDSKEEFQEDIRRVERFPGNGGDDSGSGVPAFVGPKPPARTAFEAKPLPM